MSEIKLIITGAAAFALRNACGGINACDTCKGILCSSCCYRGDARYEASAIPLVNGTILKWSSVHE